MRLQRSLLRDDLSVLDVICVHEARFGPTTTAVCHLRDIKDKILAVSDTRSDRTIQRNSLIPS